MPSRPSDAAARRDALRNRNSSKLQSSEIIVCSPMLESEEVDHLAGEAVAQPEPINQEAFDRLLASLRPKLHRYCARMIGSVIDGEDVVQEALVKAIEAFSGMRAVSNIEGWLFRIAHNTALDFLRQQQRQQRLSGDEDMTMIADPIDAVHQRQAAAAGLRAFMRLPIAQRSGVILMDVLGYSLEEIGGITGSSLPALKAALHRGRARLREVMEEPDDRPLPALRDADRARLSAYVDRFNARDFDTIRNMLADDVRLELVNKTRMRGRREVSRYFGNYASVHDWQLRLGFVDGRPAILAADPNDSARRTTYFILLSWTADGIATIRDFRHARYVIEAAEVLAL
jgi:RNA polymerase sigma-70 factor, ECF subfamily